MTFAEAAGRCVKGERITRAGWKGDRFVHWVPPSRVPTVFLRGAALSAIKAIRKAKGLPSCPVTIYGHFDLVNAHGEIFVGWSPRRADREGDKWEIYGEEK